MTTDKYPAFPKIPRLHRDVILTEKIDGTNGLIAIRPLTSDNDVLYPGEIAVYPDSAPNGFDPEEWPHTWGLRAGSRTRWITPEQDNFGFAKWVHQNAHDLVLTLGQGNHYGEWWGSGIQRGYGLPKGEKRFSLFNTGRWQWEGDTNPLVPGLRVVPVLASVTANLLNLSVQALTRDLKTYGSWAEPGFPRPEGIIVYHVAGGHTYKVLLEGDDQPKGLTA